MHNKIGHNGNSAVNIITDPIKAEGAVAGKDYISGSRAPTIVLIFHNRMKRIIVNAVTKENPESSIIKAIDLYMSDMIYFPEGYNYYTTPGAMTLNMWSYDNSLFIGKRTGKGVKLRDLGYTKHGFTFPYEELIKSALNIDSEVELIIFLHNMNKPESEANT